ncbi:MAG: ABC transporter substrate-binding protein [Candidatus Nitrosocosmicus sp.]
MQYKIKLAISGMIILGVILSSNSYRDFSFYLLGLNDPTNRSTNNLQSNNADSLSIGFFPNLNHAQAIIGIGNGDFNEKLNREVNRSNFSIITNAFPSEYSILEALYDNTIDVAYVNPNTIIEGYILLGDQEFKIISGVSSGGTSFVVRNDSAIESVNDLGGKKFASPQLGSTQDVALRKYLVDNGFNTVENGGNLSIVALKPADIISQFGNKEIDGAWVPEPVTTILLQELNGKILVDERDLWPDGKFVTGNIIVRTDYLRENPDVIKKLLEAHIDETIWINERLTKTNNSDTDGKNISTLVSAFNSGLENITGKTYPPSQLEEALSRIAFTNNPLLDSLLKIVNDAIESNIIELGYDWRETFSKLYDLTILTEILDEKDRGNTLESSSQYQPNL